MKTTPLTAKEDSPGVTLMPPAVFYTCLAAGGILEFFIPTGINGFHHPAVTACGAAIALAGFTFMMLAHELFRKKKTPVPTCEAAAAFVTQGAYRFSRNPMYTGGSAFFIGIGLLAGSAWLICAWLPLGLYLALYVVPREEAYLERQFGNQYRTYQSRVRRWI